MNVAPISDILISALRQCLDLDAEVRFLNWENNSWPPPPLVLLSITFPSKEHCYHWVWRNEKTKKGGTKNDL